MTDAETKYTPGPWRIDITRRAIVGDGDTQVAIVRGDPDCNAANAALIAAAPDMYKMLKRFATYFKERGFNTPRTCTLPTPEDVCNLIDEIERKEIFR